MQISARADYAIRAVTYLTLHSGKLSLVSDIAISEDIPAKFLEHVLAELKRAGIVSSKRGVGGGYSLARSPEEITLGSIIRLFDGSLGPVGGIERMQGGDGLTDAEYCLRSTWLKAADAICKVVDNVNFAMVAAERRIGATLPPQTITHGTAWF